MPFHVADPEGPLVQWLIEDDRVVYRPEVLRHFAAGGEYGMRDLRRQLRAFTGRCSSSAAPTTARRPRRRRTSWRRIPTAEHVVIDDART